MGTEEQIAITLRDISSALNNINVTLQNNFAKICTRLEDITSMLNNKIYYLCVKCHSNLTNSLKRKV